MLKGSYETQLTLLDNNFLLEELIPQDSWAREFRTFLVTIAPREFHEELYHPTLGRHAANPTVLTGALLVQARKGWSSRELEHHVRFDMETKYALGLEVYHKGFDHSTFEYHRINRMLKGQKDRQIFDVVIESLIKDGLLSPGADQILDSTYHNANIAIVGPLEFIRRGIVNIIRTLRKEGVVTNDEIKTIGLGGFLAHLDRKAKASKLSDGRLDEQKKRTELKKVHEQAVKLLELVANRPMSIDGEVEVKLLQRALEETIEVEEDEIQVKKRNSVKDRMVSLSDPEARYGVKNKQITFNGYKSHIAGTADGLITAVVVTPGNVHDGKVLPELVDELQEKGFTPDHALADSSYGYGENRQYTKDKNIQLYARANAPGVPDGFSYIEERDTFTCPRGLESRTGNPVDKGIKLEYSFPIKHCQDCPYLSTCCGGKKQKRLRLSKYHLVNAEGGALNKTKEYKEAMRQRSNIERAFALLINQCKLRVLKRRGSRNALYQVLMASTMLNIFSYFRLKKMEPRVA